MRHLPGQPREYVTGPGVGAGPGHVPGPASVAASALPVIRLRPGYLEPGRLVLQPDSERVGCRVDRGLVRAGGHVQPQAVRIAQHRGIRTGRLDHAVQGHPDQRLHLSRHGRVGVPGLTLLPALLDAASTMHQPERLPSGQVIALLVEPVQVRQPVRLLCDVAPLRKLAYRAPAKLLPHRGRYRVDRADAWPAPFDDTRKERPHARAEQVKLARAYGPQHAQLAGVVQFRPGQDGPELPYRVGDSASCPDRKDGPVSLHHAFGDHAYL